MKKKITILYEELDFNELSPSEKELLNLAHKTAENAYAPYSNFRVGSAVLLENGEIYTGNNQENAALSPTICGERVAMFAAAANNPKIPIKTIAIFCFSTQPSAPCGTCRQVINEYEMKFKKKIKIILKGESNKVWIFDGVKNLLPFPFYF